MTTNIIDAILHLVHNPIVKLVEYYAGNNRANNSGQALEEYVQDLFADSFSMTKNQRIQRHSDVFSYKGNKSNPPDAMLRNSDAIEVKKIEQASADLALNSSYPKHKLYANSSMLTTACRTAEEWEEKDIIYTVGVVRNNTLLQLCMVYGLDYCASEECYTRVKKRIKDGIAAIPNITFSETRELGRINGIDPLNITYLRVRGMWGIQNPWRVFDYVYQPDANKTFNFMCIINDEKWEEFDNTNLLIKEAHNNPSLKIENIKIQNPDNPAQIRNARLITFTYDEESI